MSDKITMFTVTDAEYENLNRCMEELPDPIGARNWEPDYKVIDQIKNLEKTKRLITLRNRVLDSKQQLYIKERAKLVTESYQATEGEDANIRQAKALAHVLENYPVIIRDDEIIVGSVTPHSERLSLVPGSMRLADQRD